MSIAYKLILGSLFCNVLQVIQDYTVIFFLKSRKKAQNVVLIIKSLGRENERERVFIGNGGPLSK